MRRLIDTQDAFNVLSDYYHHHTSAQHLALQEALNKVPTAYAEPRWIPCSERLPKMKEIVLITNDKGHVRCGQYRGVGFFSKNDGRPHWNWKGNTLETVVAWMPLPKPYEVNHE